MQFHKAINDKIVPKLLVFTVVILLFVSACSTSTKSVESKSSDATIETKSAKVVKEDKKLEVGGIKSTEQPKQLISGPTIKIEPNAPSDTVRVFYQRLRENKFRDALVLTNLRPAVEGLSDNEIKELGVDFKNIAGEVPEQMPITGEVVVGNEATVIIKMPNPKDGKQEDNPLKLRKRGDSWEMLVVDKDGEKRVKKEGKNYFFAIRMDVHHAEAQAMLDRIAKAQAVHSLQNKGKFADLNGLVSKGFVPRDALTAASTGYSYKVNVSFDGYTYTAFATPSNYGKSGKLSFALKIRRGIEPVLEAKDLKGKSISG